jgi:hypothetical protein
LNMVVIGPPVPRRSVRRGQAVAEATLARTRPPCRQELDAPGGQPGPLRASDQPAHRLWHRPLESSGCSRSWKSPRAKGRIARLHSPDFSPAHTGTGGSKARAPTCCLARWVAATMNA